MEKTKRRIENRNGIWFVNNSGLDLIQTCARKAMYVFSKPETERKYPALEFGSAIHSGLEFFYRTSQRTDSCLDGMIQAFKNRADPIVHAIPDSDKRSIKNGELILRKFFEAYKNDPWEIYIDEKGPFVEREFEVVINEQLRFFGTIDTVLRHRETNDLAVFDHKTASSLGKQFAMKGDVNHQMTGYIFALQKMGLEVRRGFFQGLQVAKTKCDIMRVPVERNEEHVDEWKQWVFSQVRNWAHYVESENFPMNGSSACTGFSGCQYLNVCAAPKAMREGILAMSTSTTEEEE